jgi:hypothetical protein
MLGTAERTGSRAAALRALLTGLGRRGGLRDSREVLTPLPADPRRWSRSWSWHRNCWCSPAGRKRWPLAVRDYAVPPAAIDIVRA